MHTGSPPWCPGVSCLGGQSCRLSGSRNADEHLLRARDLLYGPEPSRPLGEETPLPATLVGLSEAEPVAGGQKPDLPAQGPAGCPGGLSGVMKCGLRPRGTLALLCARFPGSSGPCGPGAREVGLPAGKRAEQQGSTLPPRHQPSPGGPELPPQAFGSVIQSGNTEASSEAQSAPRLPLWRVTRCLWSPDLWAPRRSSRGHQATFRDRESQCALALASCVCLGLPLTGRGAQGQATGAVGCPRQCFAL